MAARSPRKVKTMEKKNYCHINVFRLQNLHNTFLLCGEELRRNVVVRKGEKTKQMKHFGFWDLQL